MSRQMTIDEPSNKNQFTETFGNVSIALFRLATRMELSRKYDPESVNLIKETGKIFKTTEGFFEGNPITNINNFSPLCSELNKGLFYATAALDWNNLEGTELKNLYNLNSIKETLRNSGVTFPKISLSQEEVIKRNAGEIEGAVSDYRKANSLSINK